MTLDYFLIYQRYFGGILIGVPLVDKLDPTKIYVTWPTCSNAYQKALLGVLSRGSNAFLIYNRYEYEELYELIG